MYGVVEFSVIPVGTGSTSVSEFVKFVHNILKSKNFKIEPNSMGTVIEGEIEDIFNAILEINEKLADIGVKRVVTSIKVDYRIDKQVTIESKLKSIEV